MKSEKSGFVFNDRICSVLFHAVRKVFEALHPHHIAFSSVCWFLFDVNRREVLNHKAIDAIRDDGISAQIVNSTLFNLCVCLSVYFISEVQLNIFVALGIVEIASSEVPFQYLKRNGKSVNLSWNTKRTS
jgi:hypothetical protein